ncbi:MAG: carboxypeptidase-like regulatory domain-containing protein, partial [Blastocatellia bacterium]
PFASLEQSAQFHNYQLFTESVPTSGDYPVIPSKAGYTFTPASRQVSVGNGFDAPNTNFTANAAYIISGTATNKIGEPMNGVTMTMTGGSSQNVTTGLNGQYSFAPVYAGNNYTVTPSKGGYAFTPASRTYTNLQAAQKQRTGEDTNMVSGQTADHGHREKRQRLKKHAGKSRACFFPRVCFSALLSPDHENGDRQRVWLFPLIMLPAFPPWSRLWRGRAGG